MNTTFDPTKPVRTRNGQPARIICTDKKGNYPIVALITEESEEYFCAYNDKGKIYPHEAHESDLINTPSDNERRREVAKKIGSAEYGIAYAIEALELVNWPACAEQNLTEDKAP